MSAFLDKRFTTRDGLTLYYRDYVGAPTDHVPVLCLAGSTGTVRCFDAVAPRLAQARRVFAMDWRGHGQSDYDTDYRHYGFQTDRDDVIELLALEKIPRVVIVGSSRGGIIAMVMASQRPDLLAGAVLNDIGPVSSPLRRERLNRGFAAPLVYTSLEQAGRAMRQHQVAGVAWSEDEWPRQAACFYRRHADGKYRPDVDLGYIKVFGEIRRREQWNNFAAMADIPVLVVRGALSDILDQPTLDEMARRKPDLRQVVVPGRAHCPDLMEPELIAALDAFLATV
ncbi:MAG: alpha/beta hydrolase [Alphaproteobacteria bacterium]|nr:alpha/beta hydrolase [Alphaproteobacteria bacterium]